MFHSRSHRSSEGAHTSSEAKPSLLSRIGRFAKKTMKNIVFQIFSLSIALVGMGVAYAAWTTLTPAQGASGQVMTQTLMQGIINNLNDLNTRVSAIPFGQTTGGIVTGPLRWSSEYSGQNHTTAWNTCLALSPAGAWRLPTMHEVEYARRVNTTLFTGSKFYWSTELDTSYEFSTSYDANNVSWGGTTNAVSGFLAFFGSVGIGGGGFHLCDPLYYHACQPSQGGFRVNPIVFRCVSNS